jgi:hypothetical protein
MELTSGDLLCEQTIPRSAHLHGRLRFRFGKGEVSTTGAELSASAETAGGSGVSREAARPRASGAFSAESTDVSGLETSPGHFAVSPSGVAAHLQ